MDHIRPKKSLGQHYLKDENIARKIVSALEANAVDHVIEVGAGSGILTKILFQTDRFTTWAIEIDQESITTLRDKFPDKHDRILHRNFLKLDPGELTRKPVAIIGNLPYNISSQVFFKILENRDQVLEVVCMVQKEVAERISAPHGSKTYGILSVLLQAYYSVDYLFTVGPQVFHPVPRVHSAVIRLVRKDIRHLDCDENLFTRVVKASFNQRRKMIRNSIKQLLPENPPDHELLSKRPEQLDISQFVILTSWLQGIN
ncbi:MAG: 16S rRNA (adenine(1518)-N(6)/adenine(1519)-N(6))-dimethyltransferase RsmA [Bacteroidales bacterium]|nr:16S rRNA (adenine(1518)-N(6)/adenine(1519)-N(6))-dimethyltransferase RsmA [Bacteroidales bacterium]